MQRVWTGCTWVLASCVLLASCSRSDSSTAAAPSLRPHAVDRITHFRLPSSGEGAQSFSIVRGDGQGTVTVLPNTLVGPRGQVAVGDANISLTYWNPLDAVATETASVLAGPGSGDANSTLQRLGMLDVAVEQNGQLLQIATGKTLPVSLQLPAERQLLLAQTGGPRPELYALNPTTARWEKQPSSPALAADKSSITAQVQHLGAWCMEVDSGADQGAAARLVEDTPH